LQKNHLAGRVSPASPDFLLNSADSVPTCLRTARFLHFFPVLGPCLVPLGHTSGQRAAHATSMAGYSCGEGCAKRMLLRRIRL
jgi:hypothetical protein